MISKIKDSESAILHAKHMILIDKESNISILGAFLTSIFFAFILHEKVPSIILMVWLSFISATYLIRYIINRFLYQLKYHNSINWERIYIAGTLTAGLQWGIGSYFMLPENDPLLQAVIVLTIGGLVAAGSITYAPSKYLGASFSISALLPLSIFFLQLNDKEHLHIGILIIIYITVTVVSGALMYKVTNKNILLGIDNELLINNLENKIITIENMASKMSHQASHDMLTGLMNRRAFEQNLNKLISDIKFTGEQHVLCYMDLDEFKVINDTCGHIAGDTLLKNLSSHIKEQIRSSDIIARLGGDEFGLLLPQCTIEKAYEIANKLRKTIKGFQFSWEGKIFDVGVSIGLVEINKNSGNLTDILKAADSACYVAKDLGRNRIHIYKENDIDLMQRLGHMEQVRTIQHALNENRFVLYAQKIQPNHTDNIKWHGELLVRMTGDNNELIYPGDFIPAAERYHLMIDIDKWVIRNAFIAIKSLEAKFNKLIICAINLSGQSLCEEGFLNFIIDEIKAANISPKSICFEITETATIANFAYAERLITKLKSMGCSFSLDDFGSGLSSFGYLKKLAVDYLKIDGGFVKNMLKDEKDYAIVKSISQFGKEMGIRTIAEFVENVALHNKLIELGVDFVQGYGIAKPVPVNSII